MDFAVPVDHSENKRKQNDEAGVLGAAPKDHEKKTGEIGNQRKNWDHLDHSSVKIG